MLPHVEIHRWRKKHWATSGQINGCHEVMALTIGTTSNHIGACWSHDHCICPKSELYMIYPFTFWTKCKRRMHRIFRKGAEGEWSDEIFGRIGHNNAHIRSCLYEKTGQKCAFISCDASGNGQNNFLPEEHAGENYFSVLVSFAGLRKYTFPSWNSLIATKVGLGSLS